MEGYSEQSGSTVEFCLSSIVVSIFSACRLITAIPSVIHFRDWMNASVCIYIFNIFLLADVTSFTMFSFLSSSFTMFSFVSFLF